MLYTQCTVHDGFGGRCGTTDICTLVRTYSVDPTTGEPKMLHEHRVCFDHRRSLQLPELDVAIFPDGMRHLADA